MEVLRDLLRCAYDPQSWSKELELLEQRHSEDLIGCVERVDAVLTSRISLFSSLQTNLATFKAKLTPQ